MVSNSSLRAHKYMTYTVNMDKYSLTNVAPFKYYYIQYINTTYIQNTLPITHFSIIYGIY